MCILCGVHSPFDMRRFDTRQFDIRRLDTRRVGFRPAPTLVDAESQDFLERRAHASNVTCILCDEHFNVTYNLCDVHSMKRTFNVTYSQCDVHSI